MFDILEKAFGSLVSHVIAPRGSLDQSPRAALGGAARERLSRGEGHQCPG